MARFSEALICHALVRIVAVIVIPTHETPNELALGKARQVLLFDSF